jgi:hypothetical protein
VRFFGCWIFLVQVLQYNVYIYYNTGGPASAFALISQICNSCSFPFKSREVLIAEGTALIDACDGCTQPRSCAGRTRYQFLEITKRYLPSLGRNTSRWQAAHFERSHKNLAFLVYWRVHVNEGIQIRDRRQQSTVFVRVWRI